MAHGLESDTSTAKCSVFLVCALTYYRLQTGTHYGIPTHQDSLINIASSHTCSERGLADLLC